MTMTTFPLGEVVVTPGAMEALRGKNWAGAAMTWMLNRHASGDWGDVSTEDRAANNRAVTDGGLILSVYDMRGTIYWVVTEWDRSVTTILLPDEY